MLHFDVIIIGGGPAGLFAGSQITNKKVALFEKGPKCGRKLLMTGAGKCNVTQAGDIHNFLNRYGTQERFVRHPLLTFTNQDLLSFFGAYGLKFTTMENGKIFPKTMQAQSILDVLVNTCRENRTQIHTETAVTDITKTETGFVVATTQGEYTATRVIIATGGLSYPHTGATGDGQGFAKALGHKIIPMKPALAPVKVKNYNLSDLSGQAFDDLSYTQWRNGKKVGEFSNRRILLTHSGLSGPGIFIPSRYLVSQDLLRLNWLGGNAEAWRTKLVHEFTNSGVKLVKTIVRDLLPTKSLADKLLELADIADDLKCAELKKSQRTHIIELLIEFPFEIKTVGGFNAAQVTAGGVSLKEINPKTMESRKVSGLHFIGEVADVDGDTGGYNIQLAMAMAHSCARFINAATGDQS